MKFNTHMIAAVLIAAGTAWGQEGDFKKPLKSGKGAQGGQSQTTMNQSTTVMRSSNGENTVELKIQDGKQTATVNGKKVPDDRVVKDKSGYKVLDGEGETIAEFPVTQSGSTFQFSQGGKQGTMRVQPAPGGDDAQPKMEQPKVMIGITMGEPSEELLKNYDLKAGQAILVEKVIEGLPADKAGLKENDIITQIDGKKPVSQETLREVLRGKEPGDSVKFTVLRAGGDQTVRVTVEKFDAEKFGSVPGVTWGGMKDDKFPFDPGAFSQRGDRWTVVTPDGQGRAFVMGGDMDDRIAELDKKMADLDRKLEQVDEKIAKLQELIEKLAKHDR
jgi:hypothetical protein